MKAMYLTQEQYDKLSAELKHLKTVERPKVVRDIAAAREHGDLRENAEYAAAKEKQRLIEGKIARLEETLSRARIMTSEMMANEAVHVGSRVKLVDLKTQEEFEYEIIPSAEFSPSEEAISIDSPVGKALIGKKADEIVEIKVPAGVLRYRILSVQ